MRREKSDGRVQKEIIMKISNGKNGYKFIRLMRGGVYRGYLISRLVALHFITNPADKSQVNHINGDKSNNRFDNLEWCTDTENKRHAVTNGYYDKLYQRLRKPVNQYQCGELIANYDSLTQAQNKTGILVTSIANCLKGRSKTAGGFTWLYA